MRDNKSKLRKRPGDISRPMKVLLPVRCWELSMNRSSLTVFYSNKNYNDILLNTLLTKLLYDTTRTIPQGAKAFCLPCSNNIKGKNY